MTPVEIMALLLALAVVVKLAVVMVSPKLWMDGVTKKVWGSGTLMILLSILIVAVSLPLLLGELSIVQIFAVTLFVAGLLMMSLAPFSREFMEMGDRMIKEENALKKAWLAVAVWLVLAVWVLYEIIV